MDDETPVAPATAGRPRAPKKRWWRRVWDVVRRPDSENDKQFGQEW